MVSGLFEPYLTRYLLMPLSESQFKLMLVRVVEVTSRPAGAGGSGSWQVSVEWVMEESSPQTAW